jgi:hypothetical protein
LLRSAGGTHNLSTLFALFNLAQCVACIAIGEAPRDVYGDDVRPPAFGFERFADWWAERVQPTMRALSMRPTREIAAAVVEQVRAEEAELPPAQRRRDYELAEMVGATPDEIRNRASRSTSTGIPAKVDVEQSDLVEMPAGQEHADASLAAIDKAAQRQAFRPEPQPRIEPPDPAVRERLDCLR